MVEEDVPAAAQLAIQARGLDLKTVPPHFEVLGQANLIRVDDDGFTAASDPRSDGSAIVVDDA